MIQIRQGQARGTTMANWLQSYHTFSFAEYYDPAFMHFGYLRVINEDTIQPGQGFGTHPHQNMEIITYVVEGILAHKDSMGTGSIIKPGEIQRMSAGTGVTHSEYNASQEDPLHLLQIWIIPNQKNLTPSYEQKKIIQKNNDWILIAAPQGNEYAITIHQDVNLYVAYVNKNTSLSYSLQSGRQAWLQVIKGKIMLQNAVLLAGDGAAIIKENDFIITAEESAEILLFDLG